MVPSLIKLISLIKKPDLPALESLYPNLPAGSFLLKRPSPHPPLFFTLVHMTDKISATHLKTPCEVKYQLQGFNFSVH